MLLAGEVGKPHGLAGDVYVVVISDDPHRFEPGSTLQHDDGRALVVEGARTHGDRYLVKFEGIDTREMAATLRGTLYVPETEARDLDSDEFWNDDLVGCSVATKDGREVGTIARVISGSAQDLFEVQTSAGPRLVPVVAAIVVEVDTAARRIVIDPPEGLLE
jgi:16S rRNA processing protein RimM